MFFTTSAELHLSPLAVRPKSTFEHLRRAQEQTLTLRHCEKSEFSATLLAHGAAIRRQPPLARPLAVWTALMIVSLLTVFPLQLKAQDLGTPPAPSEVASDSTYKNQISGEFTPGKGFDVVKTPRASLNISAYGLARYINQLPPDQSYVDHLGRTRAIDTRQDIQWHRTFVWLTGFFYTPKFRYTIAVWGLVTTGQTLLFGNFQYTVDKALRLGVGVGPNLGTRSLQGSWPYFLSSDRQMADDFFRPGFTGGFWVTGEPLARFHYNFMVGDNLSILGVNANQLSRDLITSTSLWWMPTTGEFGPRGGMGDLEMHQKPATRFGISITHGRDDRHNPVDQPSPVNQQVKLSDAVLFYETGALAQGVTVQQTDFDLVALDAGVKYKGLHLQGEYYYRNLSDFLADGPLPMNSILDRGFNVSAMYQVLPKLGVYGTTSIVKDDFKKNPWEVAGGLSYYPSGTRSWRLNLHVIRVEKSPAFSQFGFYINGQSGTTISLGTDILL